MFKKLCIIALVFAGVYLAYFTFRGASFYNYIARGGIKNTPAPIEKTEYTFLLLGYGGPGHDGPYLTDSMMVVHVDLKKNIVSLISLPRDLWVKLTTKSGDDFHSKINSVYQMGMYEWKNYPDVKIIKTGSTELVKQAVQTVTGLTVDNVITVDFTGFEKAVDSLGGIDVTVLTTFDDYGYPIEGNENDLCGREADFAQIEKYLKPGFDETEKEKLFKDKPELESYFNTITTKDPPTDAFPCRYEHLHFDAGKVHMDGVTALKYVRSRHSTQDGTDFGRGARQQQFVKAIKDKLLNVSILANVFPLMDQLIGHISMDVSSDELKKFVAEARDVAAYKIINIHMSDTDYLKASMSDYGGYILIPRTGIDNWKQIQTMIHIGIVEITPTVQKGK